MTDGTKDNNHFKNISDVLDIPDGYYIYSVPKLKIVAIIRDELEKKGISIRQLAKKIGMNHTQIIRVTSANNYNIDTLLTILNGLDLEIEIKSKE